MLLLLLFLMLSIGVSNIESVEGSDESVCPTCSPVSSRGGVRVSIPASFRTASYS